MDERIERTWKPRLKNDGQAPVRTQKSDQVTVLLPSESEGKQDRVDSCKVRLETKIGIRKSRSTFQPLCGDTHSHAY